MGTLYCVCSEATKAICEACPKGKEINPDIQMGLDTWPRVLTPQIIHYAGKPRTIGGK